MIQQEIVQTCRQHGEELARACAKKKNHHTIFEHGPLGASAARTDPVVLSVVNRCSRYLGPFCIFVYLSFDQHSVPMCTLRIACLQLAWRAQTSPEHDMSSFLSLPPLLFLTKIKVCGNHPHWHWTTGCRTDSFSILLYPLGEVVHTNCQREKNFCAICNWDSAASDLVIGKSGQQKSQMETYFNDFPCQSLL